MSLTKQQWGQIAEASAAARYGEKYAGWFMARRFLAGPMGVVLAAGMLGVGGYLLWTRADLPAAGSNVAPVFWVIAVLLAIVTAVVFRPGRVVPAALVLGRGIIFALLWLGLVAFGFAALI